MSGGFPTLFDDHALEAAKQRADPLPPHVVEAQAPKDEPYPESWLERHHPHIVQKLVLLWGYPECLNFLKSLVIDWRGDRQGFRREVMAELVFLHALLPHMISNSSPWDETGQR
jgi:hypothetical protein